MNIAALGVDKILEISGGRYELQRADVERAVRDFSYHKPTAEQVDRYAEIREVALHMALGILQQVPPGRERSLALTHLEQMVMYANAGIARGES